MATLTLENVPDNLYEQLQQSATRHRRSLNSEAILCLERALTGQHIDPIAFLAQAREFRARASKLFVTDSDLRAARDEGRL